jgi:hypothetical protein
MFRAVFFAAIAALFLPVASSATTTWSIDTSQPGDLVRVAKVVEDTGTGSAPADPVKASGTFTLNTCVAGNTASVAGVAFTAHASLDTGKYFKVGANDAATATNLAAAISRYWKDLRVTAAAADVVVTVTAMDYGTAGNAITLAETGDGITKSGNTLANGVNLVGLDLYGLKGFGVTVEATGGAMTAGGKLLAYLLNPVSGKWSRAPGLDIVVTALTAESYQGFNVLSDWSRIAFVPSGIGRASSTYLVGRTK